MDCGRILGEGLVFLNIPNYIILSSLSRRFLPISISISIAIRVLHIHSTTSYHISFHPYPEPLPYLYILPYFSHMRCLGVWVSGLSSSFIRKI